LEYCSFQSLRGQTEFNRTINLQLLRQDAKALANKIAYGECDVGQYC
jgi:hypothetical protein